MINELKNKATIFNDNFRVHNIIHILFIYIYIKRIITNQHKIMHDYIYIYIINKYIYCCLLL